MQYKFHLPPVLRGLSLEIPPGAKVAICGRTGCGKSSMFGAICGLYPASGGRILIDGVDIRSLPLPVLRQGLRVISQDAVLLHGTLRDNILGFGGAEPGELGTDADVWEALRSAGMSSKEALPEGLDTLVEPGGANFSVGERQLLTLARALVPRNGDRPKLMLCDEATANVDLLTDEKVHAVLLGLDATVLMICHRLQHINKFDLVVVLSEGRVHEMGPPLQLLQDTTSMLSKLCKQAGI